MLPKRKHGFLLGKFLPPHRGHQFLCEFAQAQCERLTILVATLPNEPIAGKQRYHWMSEMFPECDVAWCNEELPQQPEDHPDFWEIWRKVIGRYSGGNIDAVFASEPYGAKLAELVGAQFVPCDISRNALPCSGTGVRESIYGNWDYLPEVVRRDYVKRVTLFGPESTGKSTLAKALGDTFDTIVVPEYGRTYTEFFGSDVREIDLARIAQGHVASVHAAKRHANRILIEDTDPIMTAVWWDMLMTSKRPSWFANYTDLSDLYILCDVDIPWVDDGTRYFKNDADRRRFFKACEKELVNRGARYVKVSGDRELRLTKAAEAVRMHLAL